MHVGIKKEDFDRLIFRFELVSSTHHYQRDVDMQVTLEKIADLGKQAEFLLQDMAAVNKVLDGIEDAKFGRLVSKGEFQQFIDDFSVDNEECDSST